MTFLIEFAVFLTFNQNVILVLNTCCCLSLSWCVSAVNSLSQPQMEAFH